MNKKYAALSNDLEKTITKYEDKVQRLKDSAAKTADALAKAKEERADALETGALEKARKLRPNVTDLESDLESYGYQLERAEAEKQKALEEMAHSLSLQVRKIESEQHAKDVQEVSKACADLLAKLDQMDADRAAGVEILRRAQAAAGRTTLEDNTSYFAMSSGKRLLQELHKVLVNIKAYQDGLQVYGMTGQNWL